MQVRLQLSALAAICTFASGPAQAQWTVNVGYHNPVVSTVGLNLLYFGSYWGFETGIGWVDVHASNKKEEDGSKTKHAGINVAGDADLKLFLSSGSGLRPYVQGGYAVGLGASDGGAGAGIGGGFGGVGLFAGAPAFYAYGSANIDAGRNIFGQFGVGGKL